MFDNYIVPHDYGDLAGLYSHEYNISPMMVSAVRYYDRYLLQKAMSVFEWTLPETWDTNYFQYNLYTRGFVCVTDFPDYGPIPQWATISGFNIFYNPSKAIISNPYLPYTKEVELGKNGELIALTPDYGGILDLVNTYSEMLANAICCVNTGFYNSRLSYMFYAKNKAQAESFKKMYDEIGSGIPAVFIDSKLMQEDANGNMIQPYTPFNAELKKNYIVTDVLDDIRRIEHQFAQKIGLPNMNTEKKERMNDMEVNKTDIESVSNVVLWHDMLQEGIDRVKKIYPNIDLSFEYRFPITAYESLDEQKAANEMGFNEGAVLRGEATMRNTA